MIMVTHYPLINTQDIPHTKQFLKKTFPAVLHSECFNSQNLPFSKEVQQTEIGHLFEHILLEYLCYAKLKNGLSEVSFSGHTDWNWKKETRGTFHITIDIGIEDANILPSSIEKSISLLQNLIQNKQQPISFKKRQTIFSAFYPETIASPLYN